MEIELIIASVTLLALVFLASIDMAFTQLSDVTLRRLASEAEEPGAKSSVVFLREIVENRARFRFALSSAMQILLIVFSVVVTLSASRFFQTTSEWLIASLIICLVFSGLFRQIIPRLLVWRDPEKSLMSLLPLVRPLYSLLSVAADPLLRVLDTKGTVRTEPQTAASLAEEEEESGEDLQALLEVGEAEGIIEEDERELLETVVEFGETRALEIMTPRTDIRALPFDATVKDARDLMITEKYSRLPVYRGTMDNIEGIVYMRDLLNSWREGRENAPITDLLRPAFCVPETKPVNELLKDMQTNHVHLVIVIDEYGGVAGVVSTEDILEELVGEIEDEDTEKAETIEITAGLGGKYFDAIGSAEIEKIEELLEVEIGGDEFTTIAGFVTSEVGYVPKKGERFNVGGLDVEILDSDEKRIHLLRLRKSAENELAIKQSDEKEKSVSG